MLSVLVAIRLRKTNSMSQQPATSEAPPSPQNTSPAYHSYSQCSAYPRHSRSPHHPPPWSAPHHSSSAPPSPHAPAISHYADASPPAHAPPPDQSSIHASPGEYSPPSKSPSNNCWKNAPPSIQPLKATAYIPPT